MKFVRIAIFLAGMMGLVIGGLTGVSSLKNDQEQAEIRSHENLKSQAALLVDQFFGAIENGKVAAASSQGGVLPYITHRATLKMNQGAPEDFESFSSIDSSVLPDPAFELRVLQAIKSQIAIGDLKLSRLGLGTYEQIEGGLKEGIFILTPVFKAGENGTEGNVEKVQVVLLDPVRAFSGVQKLAQSEQSAYLIHRNGKVLAHTVSSYVGADLKKTDRLRGVIENLFLGAQTGAVDSYSHPEGGRNRVAFVRAGVSPFAFAVEERASPAVFTAPWFREQVQSGAARKNAGFALVLIAIALIAFSVVSSWASREVEKQVLAGRQMREEQGVKIPALAPSLAQNRVAPSVMTSQAQAEKAADSFVDQRQQIQEERAQSSREARALVTDRDPVIEFLSRTQNTPTLEGLEQELASLSSEMTDSPVLYFRYHRRNQGLTLASVAGEVRIPNHHQMQAYVRKDIELQVEQLADGGRIASLNNYGPISKIMMTQLNVAHFEAWAVTSNPEVSGQARMTGVLVVLQAGMRSAQVRPVLAKLLAEAGSYIYARANKLESRAARNTKAVFGMDLDAGIS